MIKIAVSSPEIREMKGIGKTSGKPYHMRIQTAHAYTVDEKTGQVAEFPDKFEIALDADQTPYSRGHYTLSPSAVYVGRDGRMEIRPRLVPVAVQSKPA